MLNLSLLGPVEIELNGEPVTKLRSSKTMALLAYLAVNPRPHTRHALANLLWGETSEEQAKNSLRVTLNNLNKLFPDYFKANRLTVAFDAKQPYQLDVDAFAVVTAELEGPWPNVETLARAVILYRGAFLAQLDVEDAPAFAEWRNAERQRLQQQASLVLNKLAEAQLTEQHYAAAVTTLQRLLDLDPVHEEGYRHLMVAQARQGNFADAVAAYESCQSALRTHLDAAPMPETTMLVERVRAAQVHQPPPLPTAREPLLGRKPELTQIANLLENPACRLLTIVGFGGMGKTRVAMQAAQAVVDAPIPLFLNGIVFVDLVGVAQVDALPIAIARGLDVPLAGKHAPAEEVVDYLRNKEVLLLLDNFEHLLDGADWLAQLLDQCADVKLLVTSREPLNLLAEWRLDLTGLDYTPTQTEGCAALDLAQESAIQLFAQDGQRVQPDFALTESTIPQVQRLCELVAGIPLALKLAAPWLLTMTLPEIIAQVQQDIDLLKTDRPEIPPRQRSMRAIYDYTWRMLEPIEQKTMALFAIFRGGFSEEAAIKVSGADPFVLANLLDQGFLQVEVASVTTRYVIHELTRQYAFEKLTPDARVRGETAHAHFYATMVAQAYQVYQTHQFVAAVQQVEDEIDNIYAAWYWLIRQLTADRTEDRTADLTSLIRQYVPMVAIYHEERSLFIPGLKRFEELLAAMECSGWQMATATKEQQIALAVSHYYGARLHQQLGNYAEVEQLNNTVLPVLEQFGLVYERALTLATLGRSSFRLGNYALARSQLQMSAQSLRRSGHELDLARVLSSLASIASNRGHYAQAEAIHTQVLEIYRRLNYTPGIVRTLGNLGGVYNRQERFADSRSLLEEARPLAKANNLRALYMFVTSNLGSAISGDGNYTLAESLYQESLALARELGDQRWMAANLNGLARNYIRAGNHSRVSAVTNEALEIASTIRSQPDTLSSISFFGRAWAYEGRIGEALRLLLFAAKHPATMEWDVRFNRELIQELEEELPKAFLHEATAWGETQNLRDVVTWIQAR